MIVADKQQSMAKHKLVVLGRTFVGKTSLILRFVNNIFASSTEAGKCAARFSKSVTVGDRTVLLDIWDTAGQERYEALAALYYRGASAALVVYDLTDEGSFERARRWVAQVDGEAPVCVLVANKTDLAAERRVSADAAAAFAEQHRLTFVQVSAKTGNGVNELFALVAQRLLERSLANVDNAAVAQPTDSIRPALQSAPAVAHCCNLV